MNRKWKIILVLSLIGNLSIVYVGYKALEYRGHINYFLEKYIQVTNQFSGREIYAQDNAALATDSTVANRVVFLGTQVIKDWDLPSAFPNLEAINRGISGQRVAGYLLRFQPDVIKLHPEAVVIEVSSYNFRSETSVAEIADYVVSMATLATANKIKPIFTTVIPLREDIDPPEEYWPHEYHVMDSLRLYNSWLTGYCQKNDYRYVDFNELLSDSSGYLDQSLSANAIEPNKAGYDKMTDVLSNTFTELGIGSTESRK